MSSTKILQRRTNIPGQAPGITDIDLGEIAINTHEGKMYVKRNRLGEVDIVQIGEDAVENVFYVSKSGEYGNTGTSLGDSFKTLDSAIQTVTALKSFSFSEAKCARDLGYIFDGLYLDIAFGTNYNAVTSGLAYQRAGALKVTTQQLVPTRVSFNQARGAIASVDEVKASTGIGGALYRNNLHWSEIIDILINGSLSTENAADTLVYPEPVILPTPDANDAAIILQNNREWLKDELTAFIAANYETLEYDEVRCRRDIGFIVDGLTFDILYGGTHGITLNTRAYFVGTASQLGVGETSATVATYNHLKLIIDELVRNNLTSNYVSGADETGNSGNYADEIEGAQLLTLVNILVDALDAGNLDSLPAVVTPLLSSRGVSAELRNAITAVQNLQSFIILQSVNAAKNTGDTTIFLKSGDYTVNNPLRLPPKTAIVGDNLRTTTVRPRSVDSDIFYMDNGCFIKDITFRDHQNFAACVAYDPRVDSPGAGPFIVQSPYVQNCTSITNDGIGMKIDGSKCSGLRSMVSDAFTQYNAAGIGTYLLNRGYAQLVSIFTISTQTSILAETGGQCSITNSNSSFGDYGLIARGSSPVLYDGQLDNDIVLYDNVLRIRNVINRDSADYFTGGVGLSKMPSYGDAMLFDSENYYYTVLGVDSVGDGLVDITFEPGLNSNKKKDQTIGFKQRSVITSSSHTFEYVGAGTNTFTAVPQNGGIPKREREVVYDSETNEGLVVFTSTDQLGDFRIGAELTIKRQEGRIVGETFERSLYAILTPYILALEG